MASTSKCSHHLKDFLLSDTSCMMRDSNKELEFGTTTCASEVDHANLSTAYLSAVEEQIEQSKAHWSMLADHSSDMDEEEVDFEVSNEEEFRALQRHPTWGSFFVMFSGDGKSTSFDNVLGELKVGKKFAEGSQADLYEAEIKWNDPRNVELDREKGCEFVLKVFKKGTFLNHVKSQLPQGLLQDHVKFKENMKSPAPKVFRKCTSVMFSMVLLKGGRFAFLMQREHFDLRTLIERHMKLRGDRGFGLFSKEDAEVIMYHVSLGVDWLHNRDIVHRDLKASNVLVYEFESGWPRWICHVADYECSIGVIGTHFFRAPEILQACKERKVHERPEVFSRASDIYSYAMTCYEILTGKLPFENHPLRDSPSLLIDLVINQQLRPEVPTYVEDWTRELLTRCWHCDPTTRPRIGEILHVLSTNSLGVRRHEAWMKEEYGENFRS